jgi:hypothetical protein
MHLWENCQRCEHHNTPIINDLQCQSCRNYLQASQTNAAPDAEAPRAIAALQLVRVCCVTAGDAGAVQCDHNRAGFAVIPM